jgi:hypothetical protein
MWVAAFEDFESYSLSHSPPESGRPSYLGICRHALAFPPGRLAPLTWRPVLKCIIIIIIIIIIILDLKLKHLGPLHTRHCEPVTITLQALSLVEKAEPVQVHFTLRLRDQLSMWMQDGCNSLHEFLHDIEWIMFHGHLDYFQKPPLGGRSNTKPGDHGTPNTHNRWFILFYHVWGPTWMEIH